VSFCRRSKQESSDGETAIVAIEVEAEVEAAAEAAVEEVVVPLPRYSC
jgi:hypothetical protein